jgi:hypothetical protein
VKPDDGSAYLRGDGSDHNEVNGNEDEYKWPLYVYNDEIREYVSVEFGEFIEEDDWDKQPANKWVLGSDGYFYWGNELKAGEETAELTKSVTLLKKSGDEMYYGIRTDLEAVSRSELDSSWSLINDMLNPPNQGK